MTSARREQRLNTYAHVARAATTGSVPPAESWAEEARRAFPEKVPSQKKGCPRGAYLGICETGWLPGIPAGRYNRRPGNKNARYAVKAVELLAAHPEWGDITPAELWKRLRTTGINMPLRHNGQMDVALALWRHAIDQSRVLPVQSGL